MTEEQAWAVALSALFNGPLVLISAAYLRRCIYSYKRHHDARALRAVSVSLALLAAIVGGWARGLGSVAAGAPAQPGVFRVITFACFVIVGASLIALWRSWRSGA